MVNLNLFDAIFMTIPNIVNDFVSAHTRYEQTEKERSQNINAAANSEFGKVAETNIDDARNIADDNPLAEIALTHMALKSNEWVSYAKYFMTNNDANIIKAPESAKRLVNSISLLAGFGKIYEDADSYDLTKLDSKRGKISSDQEWLVDVDQISKDITDPKFREAMKDRMIVLGKVAYGSTVINTGNINPIQSSINKQNNLPDDLFNMLELYLKALLKDKSYYYHLEDTGLVILNIYSNTMSIFNNTQTFYSYTIDPGIIMGGTVVSVLCKYYKDDAMNTDTIFVSAQHPDILFSVFDDPNYVLSPEQVAEAYSEQFKNGLIYRYFDLSNTEFLDTIDTTSREELELRLSAIIILLQQTPDPNHDIPRFRISNYKDPSHFEVISDSLVKAPLLSANSTEIVNGLRFKIDDMTMQQIYNGSVKAYGIARE